MLMILSRLGEQDGSVLRREMGYELQKIGRGAEVLLLTMFSLKLQKNFCFSIQLSRLVKNFSNFGVILADFDKTTIIFDVSIMADLSKMSSDVSMLVNTCQTIQYF